MQAWIVGFRSTCVAIPKQFARYHVAWNKCSNLLTIYIQDDIPQMLEWRNSSKSTPLHVALRNGNVAIIRYLIEAGSDVNARDAYGTTLAHLWQSYINNKEEVLKLMIDHQLDLKDENCMKGFFSAPEYPAG